MTEKENNSAIGETNELNSQYFAETLEKLKTFEDRFGTNVDFMMLKMVLEQETLKSGSALHIEIDGITLIITPTNTEEDIREKLDSFMTLIEKQTKTIIEETREKARKAAEDAIQIKGIQEAIELMGDQYKELIESDHHFSFFHITWNGEVKGAFCSNDEEKKKEEKEIYVPIGTLNSEQKKRMTEFAEWQKSTFPAENPIDGALYIFVKDGKVRSTMNYFKKKSGGGMYPSNNDSKSFKGKIPDLEFEETEREDSEEEEPDTTAEFTKPKGVKKAIESLGDKYKELIGKDYHLSSLDISWDGEVSAAFYPNDGDHTRRKDIPIGALNNEQKKRMTEFTKWLKAKYPEETLEGGAFVIQLKNKKFNGLNGRVTRESGGWSWTGVTGFEGKIPDLEF